MTLAELEGKYQEAVQQASGDRDYYVKRKKRYVVASWVIRFAATLAVLAGAALPLAHPTGAVAVPGLPPFESAAQLALVCLVIAGLLVAMNQIFMVSASWSRYIGAIMRIETLLRTAYWEWEELKVHLVDPVLEEDAAKAMAIFKALAVGSKQVVEAETTAWSADLVKAMDQMNALIKEQRTATDNLVKEREKAQAANKSPEPAGSGAIRVTLDGSSGRLCGTIKVAADGRVQEVEAGERTVPFVKVSPGIHEVTVTGTDSSNATVTAKNIVTVVPDTIADVTVTVPKA